ncbi:MAG TPA: ABC transporter permease [Gemmatimonadaceae bacterium]|nr:ABC transporter permease [Gemmatimonadaceae bacterium]
MNRLWQDARVAMRGFRRSPTFVVTAVLILGVGIGMATAMWTVFNAVLLRPLPVRDADRVVLLRALDQSGVEVSFEPNEIDEIRRSSRTMHDVAGISHWSSPSPIPLLDGDHTIVLAWMLVSGNLFDLLGAKPALGRLLQPTDDSTSHVIVLSYDAWQRRFNGDPSVIGHRLLLPYNGLFYTIVGVAQPGLDYPVGTEAWVPVIGGGYPLNVVARLAPGATPAAARAEFLAAAGPVFSRHQMPVRVTGATVRTLRQGVVADAKPIVVVLTAAVGLLLLIACVNVGNLLLLRAASRAREITVRRSLGATYADIVRQLLIESGLLAAGGGLLGLGLGELARRVLVALAPAQLPRLDLVRFSGAPVAAAAMLAPLTVLVFGVLPALTAANRSLRLDERAATTTRRRRRVRQWLVASQVSLALVLLAGAGLLLKSLERLQHLDLGYAKDHLTVVNVMMGPSDTGRGYLASVYRIVADLKAIPSVTAVSPMMFVPFVGPGMYALTWEAEGQPASETQANPTTPLEVAGPDYFRALGVPILRGRPFLDSDRDSTPTVAIVSEAAARRYWPGQDPIGKRIRIRYDKSDWWTVVGVVGDTHLRVMRQSTPMIYLPWCQFNWQGALVMRSTGSVSQAAVRRAIADADPSLTLWSVQTMDQYLDEPLAEPRLSSLLLSAFGLVALALAAIGLYGIMASAVREQTRDIGVRMALGATPGRVRADVLRRALLVCLGGAAVGIALAVAASRVLASLLFEVSPTDPVALFGACGVLLVVAAIAAYLPASHASRVDPARALQGE